MQDRLGGCQSEVIGMSHPLQSGGARYRLLNSGYTVNVVRVGEYQEEKDTCCKLVLDVIFSTTATYQKSICTCQTPQPPCLDRVPPEHAISTLPVQRIGKLQNCRFINSFRMMKTEEEEEEEERRLL